MRRAHQGSWGNSRRTPIPQIDELVISYFCFHAVLLNEGVRLFLAGYWTPARAILCLSYARKISEKLTLTNLRTSSYQQSTFFFSTLWPKHFSISQKITALITWFFDVPYKVDLLCDACQGNARFKLPAWIISLSVPQKACNCQTF